MLKKKLLYNNWIFRITAPPLLGIVVYLLVLLFFGSAEMLFENFFSREVLFVIILSYLFFEFNRLIIVVLNKILPFTHTLRWRIITQFVSAFVITVAVISSVLYGYFRYVEGFDTITTELYTFNSIYLLASLFYHLYFFSIVLLNIRNDAKLQEEVKEKENLRLGLQAFKNQVNPGFLFDSLEIILSALYSDKKQADSLVDRLARIYRYTLDNSKLETVPLPVELENLDNVLAVYLAKFGKGLTTSIDAPEKACCEIIPGSLQILLEDAVNKSLVTDSLPLAFNIRLSGEQLEIFYPDQPAINQKHEHMERFEGLNRALKYYTGKEVKKYSNNNNIHMEVPLVIVDEE